MCEITNNEPIIEDKLPNKLHELLEMAIQDLQAAENDPIYVIDMKHLHMPSLRTTSAFTSEPVCVVCLAGSSLYRCGYKPNHGHTCDQTLTALLPKTIGKKMDAIDALRRGNIVIACNCLGIVRPRLLVESISMTEYADSRTKFFAEKAELLKALRLFDL